MYLVYKKNKIFHSWADNDRIGTHRLQYSLGQGEKFKEFNFFGVNMLVN